MEDTTAFSSDSILKLKQDRVDLLVDLLASQHCPDTYRRSVWVKFWYGDSMWSEDDD